jgi:hypothetical protein
VDLVEANLPLYALLLYCCLPPLSRSFPSVQSAMRPSLSPFEKGAYGTPFRVVSVEVGGPQPSVAGKASTRSSNEGAMIESYKKGELVTGNCAVKTPKIDRCRQ